MKLLFHICTIITLISKAFKTHTHTHTHTERERERERERENNKYII